MTKEKIRPTFYTADYIAYVNSVFSAVRNHPKFNSIQGICFTPPRGSFEYEYYKKQLRKAGDKND